MKQLYMIDGPDAVGKGTILSAVAGELTGKGAHVTGFAMGAWVFLTVMFLDRGMRRYSDEALRRARRRPSNGA